MNDHDKLLELASLYAVGALPPAEQMHFETHLADGCALCEAELASLRPAIDHLADAVSPLVPSPQFRERVLDHCGRSAIGRGERAAPLRAPRLALLAAAASIALATGLGAQMLSVQRALHDAREQTSDLAGALAIERETLQKVRIELEDARTEQTALTAQVSTLEATARVLTAPATRTLALAGQGAGATARARAFLSPDTRTLILYAYDLPSLPAERTYQAWVISGKTPVSAGVFAPTLGGVTRHEASDVAGLEAPVTVAVTIEPLGGVPRPSGPIVLAGR